MVIDSIAFFVFLFVFYQLCKDDFLFLRKGVTLEDTFNVIFLALPVALFFARLVYIFLHPSIHYFNPIIFLALPYFPGLSLAGGIIGAWVFIKLYTVGKKIPSNRLMDMMGIALIISLGVGIFIQGAFVFISNKLLGIEELGRGMIGIAFFILLLTQFLKNTWQEGQVACLAIVMYTLLAFISSGFLEISHKNIFFPQLFLTLSLFVLSLFIFLFKTRLFGRLVKK